MQALIAATLARLIANEQTLILDPDARLAVHRRDELERAIRALEDLRDDSHNRVRRKLEQIQQEAERQKAETGPIGPANAIGALGGPIGVFGVLGVPIFLLAKNLLRQQKLREMSRRLEAAQQVFRRDSVTTDDQIGALRTEYAFSGTIWGAKNADVRFSVGLSGVDGKIQTVSVEVAEI